MAGTDSAIVVGIGPALLGVYLHDPDNPIGTLTQFFYSPSGKKENRQVAADMLVFAGRTRPVAEYGENQTDTIDVELFVPFDDQWYTLTTRARTIFRANKTYAYRDGRGRSWYGNLREITLTDEPHGTNVSFTFERTDYSFVPASLTNLSVGGDE